MLSRARLLNRIRQATYRPLRPHASSKGILGFFNELEEYIESITELI